LDEAVASCLAPCWASRFPIASTARWPGTAWLVLSDAADTAATVSSKSCLTSSGDSEGPDPRLFDGVCVSGVENDPRVVGRWLPISSAAFRG